MGWRREGGGRYLPTAFSSMICSALVFAADMFAGLTEVEVKNRRRNEMVGNCFGGCLGKGGFALFKYGGGGARGKGQCRNGYFIKAEWNQKVNF
jgi:hypothetical protein